jgi:hypothetical protein
MMFVPERFVLKIDDDNIPTNSMALETFVRAMDRSNVIIGRTGATLTAPLCDLRPVIADPVVRWDHVSWIVLFDAQAGKVMNRFRRFSLLGAEDMALSVTNAMECGTRSLEVEFPALCLGDDGNSHRSDPEISLGYSKLNGKLFDLSYCYFISAGYRPLLWRNFSIPVIQNIRLPH